MEEANVFFIMKVAPVVTGSHPHGRKRESNKGCAIIQYQRIVKCHNNRIEPTFLKALPERRRIYANEIEVLL